MSPIFEKPLKIASKKHDLVGLRIHDKREESLPNIGLIPMQDAETEETESKDVDYSSMKVAELKELLKERDLPISGKKSELIERLQT